MNVPGPCGVFVENLIADALASAPNPDAAASRIDWGAIWHAGDGAPSEEQAIGRIVRAARAAARQIALSPGTAHAEYPPAGWPEEDPVGPPASFAVGSSFETASHELPQWTFPGPDLGSTQSAREDPIDNLPVDPPPAVPLPAHSALSTGFTWTRNVGVVLLLFVAWQLWGTAISQSHAQHRLQDSFAAAVQKHHAVTETSSSTSSSGPVLIPANQYVAAPAEGSAVAKLQVPAIGLDEIVVSGTAESDLAMGPGHYVGTAAPGQAGNVAIAGHRTTNGAPFNQLGQLKIGDPIVLTTLSGESLTYIVSQAPQPVSPSDVNVLDDFGDNRITLTTCNPEFSATQRLIVVGELKEPKPPVLVAKTKPRAYHIANVQTASLAWPVLPIVVIELGVLMLLGLSNRRFARWYGGAARWLVLVPLWGVGLYVLFGTLTSFLPSSF
jgi:LPXTG-site transpeptidase (sortase) family protein